MAERLIGIRPLIEDAIERLIAVLDDIDGDPDLEVDEVEEQDDAEADVTWQSESVPSFYLLAEAARRRGRV
ncbi:hypothetical protein ACSBOB_14790 [Mesorhizobium sp. ASY16-5R]|uniref:hypothetical protein n=1 Tax=Mesorhizobium sp. ASY16-5R TaxID=3445772 RepID=UPI003F9F4245